MATKAELMGAPAPSAGEPTREPAVRVIAAAKPEALTPANGWPDMAQYRIWTRSLGGPTSNRYSALNQINRSNVAKLRVAWIHRSGDGPGIVQCNPIVVGRLLYAPTAGKRIVALDAAEGTERWSFSPVVGEALEEMPARRGLLHWPGDDKAAPRLLFAVGKWIYALDPATGTPLASFGENGRVALPTAGTAGGAVWKRVLVIPGFYGDVFGYDVVTGELLWRFHTIPRPGEFGAETWGKPGRGANCWGGMALDESRGIAFVSTGSPKPNFITTGNWGDNLFSNCVIALNAATGERLWHFQEVRHDVWDLDIPAPPNLVTITRHGRKVDAVAQVTKIGNTLLLDRVTGEPLFPIELRPAPKALVPGEDSAPYQPYVRLPEPFVRNSFAFSRNDITNRTPEAREFVAREVSRAKFGAWFAPFEIGATTIYYGINGGAEWTGAAFDPSTGWLYVSANELPWMLSLVRDDDPPPLKPATRGENIYQQFCAPCHGPTRHGIGLTPHLRALRHRLNDEEILSVMVNGRRMMPPAPPMSEEEKTYLLDFLLARDRPQLPRDEASPVRYVASHRRLLDQDGYPGIKPPWGTLSCLDLNTGRLVWRVPLGEYPALKQAGVPKTGTENYGGAMCTAGGLVFCAGTRDATIRAFDSRTGEELWAGVLPHDGSTPPATYEVDGRQFVVVAAVGIRMLGGATGDAWVAFSLSAVGDLSARN